MKYSKYSSRVSGLLCSVYVLYIRLGQIFRMKKKQLVVLAKTLRDNKLTIFNVLKLNCFAEILGKIATAR